MTAINNLNIYDIPIVAKKHKIAKAKSPPSIKKITSQKYQKPRPLKARAYLYCMLVKSIVPCVGYSNDINFTSLLLVTARFPCDIISMPIKKSKPSPLLSKSPARTFIKVTLFCNVRLTLYLGATILPFAV